MVTLRDLTWPHFVDINRSKASLLSTLHSRSSSVPDQIPHTNEKSPQVEAFDGPKRSVSIVKRQATSHESPCRVELESCSPCSLGSVKDVDTMAGTLSNASHEAVCGLESRLTPHDSSSEDNRLDTTAPLPPELSSIDCSVCGPELERYDDLPPLPDSPLAIAQFAFRSRESFNTSMRGLIQEEPDTPIGGYQAAPMVEKVSVETSIVLGRNNLDGPRASYIPRPPVQATSSEGCACCDQFHARRPLTPRFTTFSDPFADAAERGNPIRQATGPMGSNVDDSEYTTAMVTALETPVRHEGTGMSHDGARASNAENHDENNERGARLPECCLSPTNTDGLEDVEPLHVNGTIRGSKSYILQGPFGASRSGNIPTDGSRMAGISRTDFAIGGVDAPGIDRSVLPNFPNPIPAWGEAPAVGTPAVGLGGSVPIVTGVPVDASGKLPVPKMPKRTGKKARIAGKGKSGIRKCRRLVLRKPVLSIIIGRQLAGPTKDALKLISNGVPIQPDTQGLTEAAGLPAPSPPPAPVPAPM